MREVKKEALALSKYFVSLPHPAKTILMILALSFLFGILFELAKNVIEPERLFAGGIKGILLLAAPAILSSLVLFLMRRKALFRRAIFLGLLLVACYGIFYLLSFLLEKTWEPASNLIFVGFGAAFVLWYFILLLAFGFKKSAPIFAFMQMILFAAFFLTQIGFEKEETTSLLIKMSLAAFVFLAALYVMFYIVSAPMKKNLGISSLDAISMFLSQWLYGKKDLEEVFEEIGEEIETLVWLCSFSGRKSSTLFVVPYIHFGPFGNLGGSEFTGMLSDALSQGKQNVFVFHGTATHDLDPVSSDEFENLLSACRKAIKKLKPSAAKMSFSSSRTGSVRASAFFINDSAFISYTRAPKTTEDINFGLGIALLERAKRYVKSACIVDEHNAETGDISSVEVGNPIGFEMLDATEKLFSKKGKQEKFLFATSSASLEINSIGNNGLKLALFSQGRKMRAILLADSNGIVPDFREELAEFLSLLGKECGYSCEGEVMTTDTHQLNIVRGVLNPLGTDRRGDVLEATRKMFYEAKEKLEEVNFSSAEEKFRIRVFGAGQSAEIASTINSVVAVLRFVLPLILIASAIVLLLALGRI